MTVTVEPNEDALVVPAPRPGDVLRVPAEALRELGVSVEPEDVALAAAGRWPWDEVAVQERDASVKLIVSALVSAWTPTRSRTGRDGFRPSLRQARLARRLVTAAGEHAAGLVAHVCAWVMPAEFGARVADVHSRDVCLGLYQAWSWPPGEPLVGGPSTSERPVQPRMTAQFSAARAVLREHVQANADAEGRPVPEPYTPQRRAEEAELVAWRLGTGLQHVVWADGVRRQAEITGGLALFDAWKATLPSYDTRSLAAALIEAWDAWTAKQSRRATPRRARVTAAGRA